MFLLFSEFELELLELEWWRCFTTDPPEATTIPELCFDPESFYMIFYFIDLSFIFSETELLELECSGFFTFSSMITPSFRTTGITWATFSYYLSLEDKLDTDFYLTSLFLSLLDSIFFPNPKNSVFFYF